MGKLSEKTVLITGGSSGIGLAIAQLFTAEGAYVFITGRRQKNLDEAVQQIGRNVTAIHADAGNLNDIDKVYNVIKQKKGHLDILIANAGICEIEPVDVITEQSFNKIFDINVKGVLFAVQKALPIFNNGGSIVIIGSIASFKGYEGMSIYCASKAAVRSFARCCSVELKERKIRVNVLSPGEIHTPMELSVLKTEEERKKFLEVIVAMTPMGRRGEPEEVSKAALFLASDDSSFVTGIELCVDGGLAQI